MASSFFDTLHYVKRLKKSGVSTEQAEAHSEALSDAMDELAKKSDLNEFRIEVQGQFNLLKWMLGFVLAGIVGVLFKFFQ